MTPPTIPRMCLGGAFGLYRTSISGDRRGGFAASLSPKAPPSARAHCRSSRVIAEFCSKTYAKAVMPENGHGFTLRSQVAEYLKGICRRDCAGPRVPVEL